MTPSEKILQTALQWSEGEITDAEFMRHVEADVTAAVAAEREACRDIALAIDSERGNEKAIAAAIEARGATNGK